MRKFCERCSKPFERPPKISNAQWASRAYCSKKCSATKLELDVHLMAKMYLVHKKSSTEIADFAGTSANHVRRLLKAHGVSIRLAPENKRISGARPETKKRMSAASFGRRHSQKTIDLLKSITGPDHPLWRGGRTMSASGYAAFSRSIANGQNAGNLVHQVVAREKYGNRIKSGMHIHHVDENKTNNAPSNLLLMTATAHAKWHAFQRKNQWQTT